MINTIAELLERIKEEEKKRIDLLNITHRPTIGNTYEGLTEALLNKAIFKDLNLNIVTNSFIKADDGTRSDEMDIILIEGNGELIPYTKDQFDVSFKQVIAVIQVKKRLNKNEISSSYENLRNILDKSDNGPMPSFAARLFRDSYRGICKQDVIQSGKERTTFESSTTELMYHILKVESTLPARIVFGYEGYKSEYALREGLVKFLADNKSEPESLKHGFGPLNFPNLIINGNYTLLKGDGMPYGSQMLDGQWAFYLSSSEAPILKFLEVIWTQLSYRFELPVEIFGEDLDTEGTNLFLKANIVNVGGFRGWNYEYVALSKKTLEKNIGNKEWEPVKLSTEENHVISYLCKYDKLRIDQINQKLDMIGKEVDLIEFIESLIKTGLVYQNGNELKLLTDQCQVVCIPGRGFYAADNKTGRLSRWVDIQMNKLKD